MSDDQPLCFFPSSLSCAKGPRPRQRGVACRVLNPSTARCLQAGHSPRPLFHPASLSPARFLPTGVGVVSPECPGTLRTAGLHRAFPPPPSPIFVRPRPRPPLPRGALRRPPSGRPGSAASSGDRAAGRGPGPEGAAGCFEMPSRPSDPSRAPRKTGSSGRKPRSAPAARGPDD